MACVKNISKVYSQQKYCCSEKQSTVALHDFTLGVLPCQILGLIGPNGAGKSTLFNIMTRVINRSSGNVTLLSKGLSDPLPKNVGVCLQDNLIWD